MTGWTNGELGNEVHVLPINDAVAHGDADCVCGTTTEPVERPDGSYGWVITHQALDGRK